MGTPKTVLEDGISPLIGREHPGLDDPDDFLVWVNQVTKIRHGQMLPITGAVLYESLWTTEECKKIKKMSNYLEPRRPDEPIIVLRGLKYDYLLDGNRRINTWIKEESEELHEVWIVCPVYTSDTIEHVRR